MMKQVMVCDVYGTTRGVRHVKVIIQGGDAVQELEQEWVGDLSERAIERLCGFVARGMSKPGRPAPDEAPVLPYGAPADHSPFDDNQDHEPVGSEGSADNGSAAEVADDQHESPTTPIIPIGSIDALEKGVEFRTTGRVTAIRKAGREIEIAYGATSRRFDWGGDDALPRLTQPVMLAAQALGVVRGAPRFLAKSWSARPEEKA
jgi:hypothetical protein